MQQQIQEVEAAPSKTLVGGQTDVELIDSSELKQLETAAVTGAARAGAVTETSRRVRAWRRRKRLTIGVSALTIPVSLLCLISIISLEGTGLQLVLASSATLWCCAAFIGAMVGIILGILMRPLRNSPLEQLYHADMVQAVGPLLDATEMLMPDVKLKAIDALIPLLTRIGAADGPFLTGRQRARLRGLMASGLIEQLNYEAADQIPVQGVANIRAESAARQRSFTVAALSALAAIGSVDDVKLVQRLAEGKGLAWVDVRVTEAARECLPILIARAEEQRSSNSYLRAADPPAAEANMLLRGADSTAASAPHHLLRASDTESR